MAAVEEGRRRWLAAERQVLLDLELSAIPSFRNGNLVAGVVSLGEFGLLFSLPLWLQNVRGCEVGEPPVRRPGGCTRRSPLRRSERLG